MSKNEKNEHLILLNIMEDLVRRRVKDTAEKLGACTCDTCYLNACAMALNELGPKYVTTTRGALLTEVAQMRLENQTDILVAATKSVMHVMEHPNH